MINMKKSVKIFIALLLLPLLFNIAIMFTNDIIANMSERELLDIPLPEKTQLVESNSDAGKLYGNGNGMQYIGQLLVTTELTEEELWTYYIDYYGERNWEFLVKRQESPVIYEYISNKTFRNFDSTKNNYMIELVKFNPGTFKDYSESFFWKILDWDIRGH